MVAASSEARPVPAKSAAPVEPDGRSAEDRADIARSGLLTMAGSLHAGVLGFALTLVVGGMFGAHSAGVFFEAVSIFTILNGIAVIGSDTGLLRSISGGNALHAHSDVRAAIRLTAIPVLVWSTLLAGVLWLVADPMAAGLLGEDSATLRDYLRVLAVTLVFSAFGQAALVGSRGFGDLKPYILLYQVGLSTTRVVCVAAIGLTGSADLLIIAWALPLVAMDVVVIRYVVRASRRAACESERPPTDVRTLFGETWRFNIPRGLASFFETCIVWSDVLIVGWFLGPAIAGAYAAASRFVTTGTMAMEAMRVGTAPLIAGAYAQGDNRRANEAYRLSSVWLVLLSWPWFLTLAAFAPFVLGLIGHDFVVAADTLSLMSLGILVYLLMGNINTVLLMAGRSSITATNTFVTLLVNVVLNLILVPRIGLPGAAVAWSVSLALDSALCLVRGHRHTGATPPVRGLAYAGSACLLSYGAVGLVVRVVGDQSPGWLAVHVLVGTAAFAALLYRWREPLHLPGLAEMARNR